MSAKELVERFQCPGCLLGSDPGCGSFQQDSFEDIAVACKSHVMGSSSGVPGNYVAPGLPKGFNRGGLDDKRMPKARIEIWIYTADEGLPAWDALNVPVWALEREGVLYVRTYSPRLDYGRVVVVVGGSLALVPEAIDVAEFIDEID